MTDPKTTDLDRLRDEYADRGRRLAGDDLYSKFNIANLFILQQRRRALIDLLRSLGFTDLRDTRIFEMGCGSGGVLLEYLDSGASPQNLYGCDLLLDRLQTACINHSFLSVINADGQNIPYKSGSFDLVLQYTAFSSILDPNVKQNIANEIIRILHPGGMLIWSDFWLNPTNAQTRGICPNEIRRLFPNCRYTFRRVTLAPPLVRRIVPGSWLFAALLERLKLFNSHYLAAIQPLSPAADH